MTPDTSSYSEFVMSYVQIHNNSASMLQKSQIADDKHVAFYGSNLMTPDTRAFSEFIISYKHTQHTTAETIRKNQNAAINDKRCNVL